MKVLLDHNLSDHLVPLLPKHDIWTAKRLVWSQLKNGDLILAAEEAGFAVMLTADQNLWYQQNNLNRRIALVVVNTNSLGVLLRHTAAILEALDRATPGTYEFLEIVPKRKPRRSRR